MEWVARMPGTGTLRRSSGSTELAEVGSTELAEVTPARKKAIVGKSRVEATRLQRVSFVFLVLAMVGSRFSDLHGKESLTKANGKLGGRQFPSDRAS